MVHLGSKFRRAKCCGICGDIGTRHALITCTSCKDSNQHLYCMRTLQTEHPKVWFCEDCDPGKDKASKEPDTRVDGAPNTRVIVTRSVRRSLKNNAAGLAKSRGLDSESSPEQAKSSRPARMIVLALVAQKASPQSSNGLRGNDMQKEQTKAPSSILDRGKSPLGFPSAASNDGQQTVRTGSDVSGGMLLQQARVPVKRVPRAAASWSGSCRVYSVSQELDAIHIFQAHPPLRALKKVFEFSKSMPDLLQFELTPRHHIWVDIDQHLCRDERDIGLYFFPVKKERQESYDQLLELMDKKDYAMRTRVDYMDLFIFTSSVLSSNCQEWRGSHFLWGLFKKVGKPPQEEVDMSEDMDIDMFGGVEISGKQDRVHVPPAPPLKRVKTEAQELPPPY